MKLRTTVSDKQMNWTRPVKNTNNLKRWESKTIKLNKNIIIAKTLEAFTLEAKFYSFQPTHSPTLSKAKD